MRPHPRTVIARFVGLILATGVAVWFGVSSFANYQWSQAEQSAARGRWTRVRGHLERYLTIRPSDARARLLLAEALVKDEASLQHEDAAQSALRHLELIPDATPQGATARVQEARIRFLILHQPAAAEKLLRHAMKLDTKSSDAPYLLWKLLDLTGRSDWAEETFWKVYAVTPKRERAERLREWYMSQFFPAYANPDLDRLMGFLSGQEQPSVKSEFQRLQHFRETEPDSPVAHAAVAKWFQREGDPKFALQLLDEVEPKLPAPFDEPFYVATLVAILIDLGEFERAEAVFERWPQPRNGYEFLKWQAIILDELRQQPDQAVEFYDRSLLVWPGIADWRTQYRKAQCLTRLGRVPEADATRNAARKIEKLMEQDYHSELRQAFGNLIDVRQLRKVCDFYRELSRHQELSAWTDVIRDLEGQSTGGN
ncbi:MAG: hypothetical protein HZA46_07490 [Planctomycetales bacterium]|nr:hypothetical protein [Planctomycetales bacterium]